MLKLEVGNKKTPIWKLEISELEISNRKNRNWKLEMLKLVMDMALLGHRMYPLNDFFSTCIIVMVYLWTCIMDMQVVVN